MYRLTSEKKVFGGKIMEVYGIKCYDKICRISFNKKFVQSIVDKFNRNRLSRIHFLECLYDEIMDEGFLLNEYLL